MPRTTAARRAAREGDRQLNATSSQKWDAQQYSEQARFVSDLGMPVVELLAPRKGERVLDLGCGDGVLTAKLLAPGCDVVGVDGSASMVSAARALGLDARVMDGQALQFDGEFDAVFSNAALHWMKQPQSVIDGVFRALKPGGRFVGEFGGHGNVATLVAALEAGLRARGVDPRPFNPWYFPTDEEYRALLAARGFVVDKSTLFARPTLLPGDVVGWLETFAQPFAAALTEPERPAFFQSVMQACRPKLCDVDGRWIADYVRLRFSATKPAG
jgi:trans-aconitate methyltransferase